MTGTRASSRRRRPGLLPLLCGLLVACEGRAAPTAQDTSEVAAAEQRKDNPHPAPLPEGVLERALPEPSERAQRLHALATRLKAPGAPVENPCVAALGAGCARTALDPFFEALDALAAGRTSAPTVVAAFGNSLIAGDRIVDILREELGGAFGSAGRGVLLVDRMAPYGLRTRSSASAAGWQPRTQGELRMAPHAFGITGVYHVSTASRARGRFRLEGEPSGTLWWLDVPGGGQLSVSSNGQVLARPEPSGSGQAHSTPFQIPQGASSLEVVAEGRGAVVLGVVLQHPRPGIVLDMLGVPSADSTTFLRPREDIFKSQLAERSPRLMLFFLGGNEAKRLEWGRVRIEQVREDLAAVLSRAREGAPQSACMVVGPIDAVQDKRKDGKQPSQRPYLEAVIDAEREVAHAQGCAFFNLYAAMGGEGSLLRLRQAGLVHDDMVHPRGKGLDLLGQLVVDALLRGWVETPPSGLNAIAALPPQAPAAALSPEVAP